MVCRLRTHFRGRVWPVFVTAFALAALGSPRTALAFDVTAPITYNNGTFDLSTVPVSKGGTNLTTSADDTVLVGNGSTWEAKTLPDCDAGSQALEYDTATNTFTCETISGTSAYPEIFFVSEGPVDLDSGGTATAYIGPSGNVSTTEEHVSAPIGAANLTNFRCKASGTVGGTSLTMTLRSGTCGGSMSASTLTSAPTGSTVTSADTDSLSISSGQCISVSATAVGDTNAVVVQCSVQKTANS